MQNERLAVLITRYLSKEASKQEQDELFDLLGKDPEQQYFFELLNNFWSATKSSIVKYDEDDEHFNHILALADETENPGLEAPPESAPKKIFHIGRKKIYAWSVAAAVLAAVVIIGYNIYTPPKPIQAEIAQTAPHKNEVKAKSGAKSRLTLPDGTKVWLNAESRITYNNNFNTKTREVELEGEAFFDVVKNPGSPFIVHTTGIDIKVLGTAFNVKSYPHEQTIEATLVRGLIEVVKANEPMGPKVILQPHEKLVFTKSIDSLQKIATTKAPQQEMMITSVSANAPDSVMKETSWVYNKLYFDGDTFAELAAKMERWFNVRITFKSEKVAAYRFKGVFKNETIEQALKALQLTADFKYNFDGSEVVIY
ncbi:FecR family protein [Pinibacter aurantiacus]|uniref:FecR family protein n=1 Tax=Pinibacter aurantiacus TaxID=2851599 RepID=A0A9E2S5Z1_9BACT|nr:FecR family protein [Pinibacter aurantiacus]MBV4357263.1 FecR family protein [Pinibacter aurantiacus]